VKALAALAFALTACSVEQTFVEPEPGWERMMVQKRVDPYAFSQFFDDGMAMRRPPRGTVPRSRITGQRVLTEGIRDGAYAAEIPMPITLELLQRGRNRFDVFCAACHGRLGNGNTYVARSMSLVRPPTLLSERIRSYPPGQVYRVILEGFGLMSSYAVQLGVTDRWAVVAYLRALQLSQSVPLASLPAGVQADTRRRLP
jgi:hypothetical protein